MINSAEILPNLVYRHARERGDQVALTSIGQGSLTWAQLWSHVERWAGWLTAHGVGSEHRVVTLMPQSLESSCMWMACSAVGAVECAVNTEFRGEWLRNALAASRAQVVVVSRRFLDQLIPVLPDSAIHTVLVYDDPQRPPENVGQARIVTSPPGDAAPAKLAEPQARPHQTACILYTSGTTGPSKAVQIPWGMMHTFVSAGREWERASEPVYYLPYASNHLSGRGALYRAALGRGRAVIREVFSTGEFWSDVRAHGCTWTLLYAAPSRFLLSQPEQPGDADNKLELVMLCPLIPEVDVMKRRFGFECFTVYGMTEIGNPFILPPEESHSGNAGCGGRPIAGVQARLVDENDYEMPIGEPGELIIRSDEPWIFNSGYEGEPAATAASWRNGWFHTGDIMRRDANGNYHYVDRRKDMIRRRGENISSVELELAVLKYPDIAEAAAVGVPSSLGDEDVLIAVVPKAGCPVDVAQLLSYLRANVPRYAVPRYVRTMERLPRTPATLRVQKKDLRNQGITPDTWENGK